MEHQRGPRTPGLAHPLRLRPRFALLCIPAITLSLGSRRWSLNTRYREDGLASSGFVRHRIFGSHGRVSLGMTRQGPARKRSTDP